MQKIIDIRHPFVLLADSIYWYYFEEIFAKKYNKIIGGSGIDTRLIVFLRYLKYKDDLSDRKVVDIWKENVYWQYLSRMQDFVHALPIHPSTMTR